ncbi:MAG: hypothetical protein K9H26_06665 [Prolixibacteraceae bacterium]|nr:hypothetical protein [Prolixibacteraceae bacterium]
MSTKIICLILILNLTIQFSYTQTNESLYFTAFSKIDSMLTGKNSLCFKSAVFLSENTYFDNHYRETDFNDVLEYYASICRGIMQSGNIIYPEKDSSSAAAQCAVFMFITDSIPITTDKGVIIHTPFQYNFEDFAGQKEWSNMFVSTLMKTKVGNCHSLPYLYKMIMDELGQKAYLSLAPNHIYIKAHNKRVGWYNIELTCGDFPTDAWLMASGYIHIDALRNGIYMDTLTQEQSVALCLVDLAQGYQTKFGVCDGSFILKCCETALDHFPKCINAMLLKAETLTTLYKQSEKNTEQAQHMEAKMNEVYAKIHQLGYRKMPRDMYVNWLNSSAIEPTNYRMNSLIMNKNHK